MSVDIGKQPETIVIDVYPWAAPTEEQKRLFDALSPEEKREMIRSAIQEGLDSGVSEKSVAAIIEEVDAESSDW